MVGSERPLRILNVLGMMDRCGVETWLMNILRTIDRERYRMDFVVDYPDGGAYDDEACALGSRVIVGGSPHHPIRYAQSFRRILGTFGPYDIVHFHERIYSYVLPLARRAGVPVCIAHSHNDDLHAPGLKGALQERYRDMMDWLVARYATMGLACSVRAAEDRFGPQWRRDPRYRLLYCGIDLAPFRRPADRAATRAALGIPPDAFVVGHVGKFAYQKNHDHFVHTLAAIVEREPTALGLLVGKGVLYAQVAAQVAAAGLADRVVFAGSRPDVPDLLRAMDVFLFPSRYEGLGLALVEAQAAGLPCVASDVIPTEADVVPGLVRRLALGAGPGAWAEAALRARGRATDAEAALRAVAASPFDINVSRRELERVYGVRHDDGCSDATTATYLATGGRAATSGR